MTARLKRNSIVCGRILSELGPTMTHRSQSFHTSRTSKLVRLPSIAGIGLGIQNIRSVANQPVSTTAKSFPSNVRATEPEKSVASKSVQVSSDEESLFLSKIEALKKENHFLKSSLKEKEHMVIELNTTIKTKTLQFTKDIELEIHSHETTRKCLERSQRLVEIKEQLLDESRLHYEKVNRELQSQYEDTLASLREQSQREMSIRDEKINKLKLQLSELFKDKSWEHQKQMEELQKELSRLAEEAQFLRTQLKRDNHSKHECEQCKSLSSALEDSRLQLKLKNRTIEELQSVCKRFGSQLQEQEKLQKILVAKNSRKLK
ncbi:uncharacterized protein LOC142144726 [Mixophyes fleayi]|uniref:uncharacterized protein LOC142144726 n=1 Tax=Mixophyes fleayi TaxID=3061075 RepID=UPI003F4E07F1